MATGTIRRSLGALGQYSLGQGSAARARIPPPSGGVAYSAHTCVSAAHGDTVIQTETGDTILRYVEVHGVTEISFPRSETVIMAASASTTIKPIPVIAECP